MEGLLSYQCSYDYVHAGGSSGIHRSSGGPMYPKGIHRTFLLIRYLIENNYTLSSFKFNLNGAITLNDESKTVNENFIDLASLQAYLESYTGLVLPQEKAIDGIEVATIQEVYKKIRKLTMQFSENNHKNFSKAEEEIMTKLESPFQEFEKTKYEQLQQFASVLMEHKDSDVFE